MQTGNHVRPGYLSIAAWGTSATVLFIAVGLFAAQPARDALGPALGIIVALLLVYAGIYLALPLAVLAFALGTNGLVKAKLSRGLAMVCLAAGVVGLLSALALYLTHWTVQ